MEIILDMNKLTKSIRDIRRFEDEFVEAIENGVYELAIESEQKLHENIAKYGLGSGEIPSSVSVNISGHDSINISVNAKHADFVEYGTGITEEKHPNASKDGWIYDSHGHGEDGWWYPTEKNYGKYLYQSKSTGNWIAWTDGMDARPFMYDTWLWASRSAVNIIRKHIRRIKV